MAHNTILWLKVVLSAAMLALLYFRYKTRKTSGVSAKAHRLRTKVMLVSAVLFSFAVFHDFGSPPGDTFVHYGEMFHYYLGAKYFKELGYYELYNAVIAADAEQDNLLAGMPFYTDLRTYQNLQRQTALQNSDRVKSLFSNERWNAFKSDVSFFKKATGMPRAPGLISLLMDHGYNASPVSTCLLGMITNLVPVTQLRLLAVLDVFLVATMIVVVFRTYGLEMGALFSVYFFVNILNDRDYISGSLLRYDWLLYIVVAVCLLEKGRYASSAFFLSLSAMLRVFPAMLFYGVGVVIFRQVKTTRALDKKYMRFILTAGVTGVGLFLLPAVCLGSVLQPWEQFYAKTELHDSGVYFNHLGLRGIVLFEPSHLSLEKFIATYKSERTPDIVRHWQDVKEFELKQKKPFILFAGLLVLACLTTVIWRRKASESESVSWPLLLIYTVSFASHYYYAFLCLLVLLFFRRPNSLDALVPLCLLLLFNIAALVTEYFKPFPIALFTLINIYLFICLFSILGFELYMSGFRKNSVETVENPEPPQQPRRNVRQRRRRRA